MTEDELATGLGALGFRLDPSEVRALLQHMDEQRSGHVRKSAFLASQLDWPSIQTDYRCRIASPFQGLGPRPACWVLKPVLHCLFLF